jgi:SAM-dependent methyltransferase
VGSTSPAQRDFYETAYHFDSDVRIAMEPRIRRALDLLAPHTGTDFLDVGSGVGWAAHFMTEDGARLAVGFDFARRALLLGQQNIAGVERVQADGGMLPFRDNAFDRALSFGSLEHFPDVDKGLGELARVLRADGVAVVVVPNFFSRTEQPQELRLSYSGWRKRFEAAGLRITATRADPGPPVFKDRRPVRMAIRVVTNALAYVPYLPYQFIFKLEHAR